MDFSLLIGLIAAVLVTISSLPQFIKTVRTKKTRDISLGMYVILCLGLVFWLMYGIILGDIPLILANSVSLILCGIILVLKLKYG